MVIQCYYDIYGSIVMEQRCFDFDITLIIFEMQQPNCIHYYEVKLMTGLTTSLMQ
jgi:hypothetical protein